MSRILRSLHTIRVLSPRLGPLLVLFQRSPVVQMLFPEARIVGGAGLGEITGWTVATIAGLGAYDSVAGASTITQLTPSRGSTNVPAAKVSALSFAFQCTGTETVPASWQIIGKLPSGLVHKNAKNNAIDAITGTPHQTGSFPITIKAWEFPGNTGLALKRDFTIKVGTAIISRQPSSPLIRSGTSAKLTVVGSGLGLTYQWFKGSSPNTARPVSKATAATFKTPALTAATQYWVRVTRGGIIANSKTATVSIGTVPVVTTHPLPATIDIGGTATLTVAASGSPRPTFQWYLGTSPDTTQPISGATAGSFITPALSSTTSYWARARNSLGSANSLTATVTVTPPASADH